MSKKPRPMPKFKVLRPAPPDSPIYKRGFLVGVTVFGKRAPTLPTCVEPKKESQP